jgi:protein-tyrosine phosphatase
MPEFVIHALSVGGGTLAISPMPGLTGSYATDRDRLLAWRPALVVSMTPLSELARKDAAGLTGDLAAAGIAWRHVPVEDFGVPDAAINASWPVIESETVATLAHGDRVLVHCHGGCGRSGMAALRLMIAAGERADAALIRLRSVRPCAIETAAQMAWAKGRTRFSPHGLGGEGGRCGE